MEEFSIMAVTLDEGGKVSAVGKVASSLSGQGEFDAHPAHFFQEEDSGPQFCGPPRSHQTRGAPTHYDHVPSQFFNHSAPGMLMLQNGDVVTARTGEFSSPRTPSPFIPFNLSLWALCLCGDKIFIHKSLKS